MGKERWDPRPVAPPTVKETRPGPWPRGSERPDSRPSRPTFPGMLPLPKPERR